LLPESMRIWSQFMYNKIEQINSSTIPITLLCIGLKIKV
jgi:hypothetical protein